MCPDSLLTVLVKGMVVAQDMEVKKIVEKWKDVPGSLIMALHEVQEEFGYISRDLAMELAKGMHVPLARIYEVITFYSFFKLTPPGKHKVQVCMGTACYLKGAQKIVDEMKEQLKIGEGETTPDGLFQLELVRCVGCCGLSPVVVVGEKTYGKVDPATVSAILAEYEKN